jgi:hypothetical protein
MTQSFVKGSGVVIRPADFRGTLAQDKQLNLFGRSSTAAECGVFAILIHGLNKYFPDRLAFIEVQFPNSDCTGYIDGFDLFGRFPDLAATMRPSAAELSAKRAELRRNRKDETG